MAIWEITPSIDWNFDDGVMSWMKEKKKIEAVKGKEEIHNEVQDGGYFLSYYGMSDRKTRVEPSWNRTDPFNDRAFQLVVNF